MNQRTIPDTQSASANRLMVQATVQLAASGIDLENHLFTSTGRGRNTYTIRPLHDSPVPLQRIHRGPGAIPDDVADLPLNGFDSLRDVLRELNSIFGTAYAMDSPGISECLDFVASSCTDLGVAYGVLRSWWFHDFRDVLREMTRLKNEDGARRTRASKGTCLLDVYLPPRRVWDLFSNRVLPYHAIRNALDVRGTDAAPQPPATVWCVSHSWVAQEHRQNVMTTINERQWPVPIPRDTTLAHIRIELLNMGAQYVWLDVLCLRQEDRAGENENLRKEEWGTDVPTIGYLYSGTDAQRRWRPCVTYFSGLGLPLNTSPGLLESKRHWFSRVWTLQESLENWLPGGLTPEPLTTPTRFFAQLNTLLSRLNYPRDKGKLVEILKARHCETERDRILGFMYLLGCETLPVYDIDEDDPKEAWALALKHMDARVRTIIFLYSALVPSPFSLWPSWPPAASHGPAVRFQRAQIQLGEDLDFTDHSQLYTRDPCQYFHSGYAIGPCQFVRPPSRKSGPCVDEVSVEWDGSPDVFSFTIVHKQGVVLPDIPYMLLGIGEPWKEHLVVIECVGTTKVGGKSAIEAIKWGVLRVEESEGKRILALRRGKSNTQVVYLEGEEAKGRSEYSEAYESAFREASSMLEEV